MDKRKIVAGALFGLLIILSGVAVFLTFGRKSAVEQKVEAPVETPASAPTPIVPEVVPATPEAAPAPVVFKVTGVTAQVSPTNSDTCSPATTFTATGNVTANAAGTTNYRWDKSDGTFTATQSLVFTTAGTKTVTATWSQSQAGDKWMKLHVLTPADTLSSAANFTLSCPFRVNRVEARETGVTGDCTAGKKVAFEGLIEANAPGDVTYIWKRSDGASSSTPTTIHFDAPGTKTVTTEWNLWTTYSGWEQLQTTTPNVVASGHAEFSITCP